MQEEGGVINRADTEARVRSQSVASENIVLAISHPEEDTGPRTPEVVAEPDREGGPMHHGVQGNLQPICMS